MVPPGFACSCITLKLRQVTPLGYEPASSPHVVVQEGEHVWLPDCDPQVDEIVPLLRCPTNRRIDLQAVRLAEPRPLGVQGLARGDRVVVGGMDE